MRISHRVQAIQPSITLAVSERAAALRKRGVDVIGFGAGEPDFNTPEHIQRAAALAVERGATKYTHVAGTAELRAAVAEELARAHGLPLAAENVLVSVGAKHSLYNLFMALLDDGDEVVIPAPCWVSYPEMVHLAGGVPVILEGRADEGYRIDERRLAERVSRRTRAIVVNSPCNPTGAVFDAATLEGVARVVRDRGGPDTYVISDDIYRRLVYRGEWRSIAHVAPDLGPRTLLVDGISKSYAMTGWRIGFFAGPRELVDAMATLQGQSTTNPAAVSQAAALAALTGPQDEVEAMRIEFDHRRRAMVDRLRAIPGLSLFEPEGAFYCFVDASRFIGRPGIPDDVALATRLLDQARVAVVPGSGFLAPGHIRLSYATSMKNIEEGMTRLARAFAELA